MASAGVRVDYSSYRNIEYQPSFRLLFTPKPNQSAWAAVSRAVRTPNRVDRDIIFDHGSVMTMGLPTPIVNYGSKSMLSEEARTVETGYRFQAGQHWSIDVSAFRSIYSRLRSIDSGQAEPAGSVALWQLGCRAPLRRRDMVDHATEAWLAFDSRLLLFK